MPTDRIQNVIDVGTLVNVPCTVTAVLGTPQSPTVALQTVQVGFAGTKTTVTTLDAIQVVKAD